MIAELFFWTGPRRIVRALLLTVAIVVVSLAAKPSAMAIDSSRLEDGHAVLSLDLAIASAFCGQSSSFSTSMRIPHAVAADMTQRFASIRSLIVAKAGSIDAYCARIDTPFVNSENALMRIEALLLRLNPDLSVDGIAQWLYRIKLLFIAAFVLLLMAAGASVALGLATFLCGLMLLQSMPEFVYSTYPFFFAMVLLAVAVHGLALQWSWTSRAGGQVAFAIAAGLLAGFIANMRTSYLPIVSAFFAAVLVDIWRHGAPAWPSRMLSTATLIAAFVAAFVAMQAGVITRGLPEDRYNASHPFAHPLVLAIAVPGSEFSRAQGIEWSDAVGPRLAERVDPGVPFLGPRYNAALLKFYRSLWRQHTREMAGVYVTKFSLAGANMIEVLRSSPGAVGFAVSALLLPLALLPNGILLMLLYAAITIAAFRVYVKRRSIAAFTIALLSMAALFLQIETGMIFSMFVKQYHSYSAFYVLFISLLAVQGLANAVSARAGRRAVATPPA